MTTDLVVLPYTLSSQSGAAAASYGAGCPVVATPIGGLAEQVLPSMGVPARDMSAQAFADALTDMITNPELFDLSAIVALHYAQTELSWQRCAEILTKAIQQVRAMPRHSWIRQPSRAAITKLEMNDDTI